MSPVSLANPASPASLANLASLASLANPGESGESGQSGESGESGQSGQSGESGESGNQETQPVASDPTDDQELEDAIRSQQEVREELEDLISLLDRDEDAWVVTRQVESMLEESRELLEQTSETGDRTMGRARGDLSNEERSEIDRIAERQRDAARKTDELADELRDRSRVLEETDPQRAESLQSAARRAERSELSSMMEESANQIQENRMSNAQQSQQATVETLERMLEDLQEDQGARAEQLIRQLSSLVQSIERLITVNEDQLIELARLPEPEVDGRSIAVGVLATSLIQFVRNTEGVASEARSAGQEAQRIARSIDRAADEQGLAIKALRSDVPETDQAEFRLDTSLTELRSALEMAQEAQAEAEQEESGRQREELRKEYAALAEREVGVRTNTEAIQPQEGERLARRDLVKSRRLAIEQESIRIDLRTLREEHPELDDSILFDQMHELIDGWSRDIGGSLQNGKVDLAVQDRQDLVIEGLIALADALEQEQPDDDNPFEQNQQEGGGQGGEGGQQGGQEDQLVPPVAELKLLRSMQGQIYNRTRRVAQQVDQGLIPSTEVEPVLRELGAMQEELHQLGTQLLESLQENSDGLPPGAPVAEPALPEESKEMTP